MSTPETITISADDGAELLGYLEEVEDIRDYDAWDGLRRRLHLAVFGAELPPRPEPPTLPPEQAKRNGEIVRWANALMPRETPILTMFKRGLGKPPTK